MEDVDDETPSLVLFMQKELPLPGLVISQG